MKRFDLFFTIFQVPLDFVMLFLAGLISYSLRYQGLVTQLRPVLFDISFAQFVQLLLGVALVGVIVFAWSGLYSQQIIWRPAEEFKKVFLGVSTTLLIIVITIFLRRELFSSRFIILSAWFFAVLLVYLARILWRLVRSSVLARGPWGYFIVLIGSGEVADLLQRHYTTRRQLGYRVVKVIPNFSPEYISELEEYVRIGRLDEIIQLNSEPPRQEMEELITFCNNFQISLLYLASFYQTQLIHYDIMDVAGYPIIRVKRTPLDGWGRVAKRLFDIIFGVLFIIIISPVMLFTALIVKLNSPGPAILKLRRVGQKGKPFNVYKFRSMVVGAEQLKETILPLNERSDGPLFKVKDDPRVTSVGRFIRRSSIDELPQLWNVIRGDMSLVGPRPHEPGEVSRYTSQYRKLLTIKPGLTGAAQVSGRSSLPFAEEAALDIYYIENWSLFLDIKILAKTPAAIFNYHNVS